MTSADIDANLDNSLPSLMAGNQQQMSDPGQTSKGIESSYNVNTKEEAIPTTAPVVSPSRSSVTVPTESGVRVVAELLRAPSPEAQKSQFSMIFGVFILSVTLGACALCLYDEIFHATGIQSGLFLGSIGTVSMCAIIIGSFLSTKWYRRHMHILLLNLALCEFCLALSFLLEPVWNQFGAGVGSHLSCRWLSTAREYLIMCSSAWTTCTALDLYYLMTNPFTSPRSNRHKYQGIAHGTAVASAVIMGVFNSFKSPVSVGSFCWIGADTQARSDHISFKHPSGSTIGIWVFIVTPTTVSIVANLYVTLISYTRFRRGVSATLRNRRVLLREGLLTTVTLILYSSLLWGVYGAYWLTPSAAQARTLSRLFAFLLSYRGSVPFILWCLYNRPQSKKWKAKSGAVVDGSTTNDTSQNVEDEDDEDEDAVRPQMNLALLDELVFYTTHGIAEAVRHSSIFPPNSSEHIDSQYLENGPSQYSFMVQPSSEDVAWTQCRFTAFRPLEFQRIRRFYDINDDAYLHSLQSCTTPKVSEGASGSFVYYSSDRSYVVKSLTRSESAFLHEILDEYTTYIEAQHGASFLTRFLGSYCLELYGRPTFFVVMENVFDVQQGISIHQRYDIKGSWVDRNAKKPRRGAEATCRHCNLSFRCGSSTNRSNSFKGDQFRPNVCPNRAGAPHEPNVVLKDMDLTMKLRFGKDAGKTLLGQLMQDSDFLCARGVMDYSLLLGVIEVSYVVNRNNILTRDGSVFLPPDSITKKVDNSRHTADNYDANDRVKQSTQCLRAAEVVIGPGFYYIGIIDMLQTWNWRKRAERFIKTVLLKNDPDGISAMPPKPYRDRFHRKLREIIHLGHNSRVIPPLQKRADTVDGLEDVVDKDDRERSDSEDEYDRFARIRPRRVVLPHVKHTFKDGQQLRGDSGEIPMTPSAQGRVLGASL
ncbi:Phosphatidylinositol-4-phosphate-5-kinase (PIPK-D6/GPCR-PIPK/PiGK6) [Plasmopara halstedii]|uniref:Phosphatidylinositol-4-phosphate-5-kinase (PIPK-D6/GPCR-PIPK/PiGK6) n=1 Tax=Plasmopara halstedii TaxID=4781 RepID=A0A0N7L5Q5_PLAHL|nr:Phosphatidylinositol-4-phosphate-5-kinase (PIPK-D6/GPCR-PIPK/PiGK6) [Plasmopara halstedii]CEG42131.1 Phosphatidylinositol-4-phosphate-5-kinase (PIPK-D6/GPCR-PIPK/PiGK6) [Plasmopara halstedii]|eukprot:XP_024578500.1 Phosphatidylinositol-4-phosphate-5-kinase (PIPK-D6/GPCR-PIPK/PiGK6) [Plasmopara halstedii]